MARTPVCNRPGRLMAPLCMASVLERKSSRRRKCRYPHHSGTERTVLGAFASMSIAHIPWVTSRPQVILPFHHAARISCCRHSAPSMHRFAAIYVPSCLSPTCSPAATAGPIIPPNFENPGKAASPFRGRRHVLLHHNPPHPPRIPANSTITHLSPRPAALFSVLSISLSCFSHCYPL